MWYHAKMLLFLVKNGMILPLPPKIKILYKRFINNLLSIIQYKRKKAFSFKECKSSIVFLFIQSSFAAANIFAPIQLFSELNRSTPGD